MSRSNKLLVAAIDFGTTYSWYAFSFIHDYETDPLNIRTNKWPMGYRSRVLFKTPTCVLFNKDKEFDSFGYEAQDKYLELAEEEEHQEWYFFRRFKMSLYNKKEPLSKAVKISATDGKEMLAIDVFSAAIKFFTSHLLESLEKQKSGILQRDIQWVLIVPAIWGDVAKHFMREAAEKAGICGNQILIVPEPEAVFVYCMHIKTRMDENDCFSIEPGTKCMVVIAEDIGVEIAVYDVQPKGILKELYTTYNCDWSGNKVGASFSSLLTDIFGNDVMEEFLSECEDECHTLLIDFAQHKRSVRPDKSGKYIFKVPIALEETFLLMYPESDVNTRITSIPKYENKLIWRRNSLQIDAQVAKALFDESCRKIIYHLQELFLYPTLKDVSSILLVGDYAMSPMLKFALSDVFRCSHEVFVPDCADVAVLKGAIIYGHQPNIYG